MAQLTCGFIGLGLIGGSIARALKDALEDVRIIACDPNPATLELAALDQVADITVSRIDDTFRSCDYIFLCAPVACNDDNLLAVKNVISPDCILTDVGSVKSDIHMHIAAAGLERQFIGGHPMAGSERTGYANSKALLLQNAYYILTPSQQVPADRIAAFRNLVTRMGAIPLLLSCDQHDYVTAAVSHLPHIIAASLVNLVRDSDSADGVMKMIAAGGFKDITRIASSSPEMWQQICLTNTENIVLLLTDYIHNLEIIREDLLEKSGSRLYGLFDDARTYRDSFINASSGPIKRVYELTVDIADEPGALASIATMLALHSVSIKNIGITHNRE
ncbi:MAG: prephenate dehydrogenase/arogenate dehydrogenase family protein, partial [Lachnospiraceae bacterium]|nr:prephenate dehydrogenase/arogenate dehydrogenase family protein [Lachnospiraceae bacterium]